MKNGCKKIRGIVFVASLLLFFGFVTTGAFTTYAGPIGFSNHLLSSDGGVVANYDADAEELTISGAGTVEYDRWVDMARKIRPTYYYHGLDGNPPTFSWGGTMIGTDEFRDDIDESDMTIVFSGAPKAIKLCGTELPGNGLFAFYSGQLSFNGAVDLAPDVTDVSTMFAYTTQFNEPVDFNTSNVTNMYGMFGSAVAFNQPLNFDTSNVTNMYGMFGGAANFNKPLNFDTSNVTNMYGMFAGATNFNQRLYFDTSQVTTMYGMFSYTDKFNRPLHFDTSRVTDMKYMFYDAKAFNQPLAFDTGQVTDMRGMFSRATAFNRPLVFDTSQVIDMAYMFYDTSAFNKWVEFDISSAQDMEGMFQHSSVKSVKLLNSAANQNISAEDVFADCPQLRYLEFSGLVDARIDGFSGDYYIVKNGGAAFSQNADDGVDFDDNAAYLVYLQTTGLEDFELSEDGEVKATYEARNNRLLISGHGQIARQKWIDMAQQIDSENFTSSYTGWEGDEPFAIYFESDAMGKIKLPNNCYALFLFFDNRIYFSDAVDTSEVTDMRLMFLSAVAFNQPINFDTSSVEKMSYMLNNAVAFKQPINFDISSLTAALAAFKGSAVEIVIFNNAADNQNIDAMQAFNDCRNLRRLQFSGLKDATIDGFSDDYYVVENGGAPIAKNAEEPYDFVDNQSYLVYLQSATQLGVPTVTLSKAGGAIKVSWTAVPDATGYQVYRADKNGGPFTKFKTTSGLVYTNSGNLVPGMPYYYKVRAYKNDGGNYSFGDFSDVKGYYAPGALAAPAKPSLTLDKNGNGIRLNWNAQKRITGYQVFRSLSPDKPFSYLKTASGNATRYTNLAGLTPGRPFYYKIRAYRMAKGVRAYSRFSDIKGLFAGTDEAALGAVSFSLEDNPAVSAPNVRIRWTGVSGADGYCVYRWNSAAQNWTGLKLTGPDARVYTNINGVINHRTNFYGMRPYHVSGGTTYYGNIGQAKGFRVDK